MKTAKKRLLVALLTIIMVLGLFTACSGGSTPTSSTAPAGSSGTGDSSTPAAEGGTIKIGMSAPITGANAEYGKGFQVAVQMAMDDINEAGGIDGKTFVLEVQDSKSDAKEASEIARKFTADSDMLLTIGDFASTVSMTVAPIYGDAGMVLISPSSSNPDFAATNDYSFTLAGRTDTEAPFNVEHVMGSYLELETVAAVYVNNDWGVSASGFYKTRAEEIGMNVTAIEPFNPGEKDFTALVTKLRQSNPEGLNVMAQATDAAMFVKQVRQQGWDVPISLSGSAYTAQLLELGGDDVEGCYITSPFYIADDFEEGQKFLTDFEEEAGFIASANIVNAYDTMMVIADAYQRALDDGKTVDREVIKEYIAATKDYEGLAGTFTFSENGDFAKKHIILQIEGGEFVKKTDFEDYEV